MTNIIRKSKLALLTLVALAGLASPVYAQSFSRGWGTGNVLPFSYSGTAPQHERHVSTRSQRYEAYAMSPRTNWGGVTSGFTAGGSVGYNQMLMTH